MMTQNKYGAVIIGGGASGLMCAAAAKSKNKNLSVAIIEKNDRTGKKLLSTGNGRCNLTNREISSEKYRGTFCSGADKIFSKYTADCITEIFKNLGLLTYSDSEGRYYPVCKQASAVLDVLRFACERLGVDIFCGECVKSLGRKNGKFYVNTENMKLSSDKLVIACGSKSAPKLGGTAAAVDYLKNFGHSVIPFSPALCPVKVSSDLLKSLKGIRITGKATLLDKNGSAVKSESGEIQFTDTSLSGICIFNLSLYNQKDCTISLNILPDYSYKELFSLISRQRLLFGDFTADNLFTGIFQKRIGQALFKLCGIRDFSRKCSSLSDGEIKALCSAVQNMIFKTDENSDFSRSQCSLGGAAGNQIDENTMESKIVKGLYICGEAVDICGECGGYNLHFAFSSGHLAGEKL